MITISQFDPASAWKAAFISLYQTGKEIEFNGFYKNSCAAIEILSVTGEKYSSYFPMARLEIDDITNYLVYGRGSTTIRHDWTKLYRQRLFEDDNQIEKIIELLQRWPDCPRAQISAWDNQTDRDAQIAPCLQILWFKIIGNELDLHVHMRTSDCYGKLLMNFNQFIALQVYVTDRLGLSTGIYRHFVDSLHFHNSNRDAVDDLYKILR